MERDIFEMSNGDVLPNHYDHRSEMKNYITLIRRILVERIPCFAAMKPHVLYHIPHKHSKEAKEKTENVCIVHFIFFQFAVSTCIAHIDMTRILNRLQAFSRIIFIQIRIL